MAKKQEEAIKFVNSMRGRYIVSQALTKAIEVMKKEPTKRREASNIRDMEYLRDTLFPIFYITQKAEKKFRKVRTQLKSKKVKA